MKIAIVAGEVSGDHLGAQLAADFRELIPNVKLIGVVGDLMLAAGVKPIANINRLSVHGLLEVLPKLPKIYAFRRHLIDELILQKPDIVIGVDAPAFNLGLLNTLRKKGIKTMQMVCPTIWAWRSGRHKLLKQAASVVLTLYPFENEILDKHKIPSVYLGHPLAQNIAITDNTEEIRKQMQIKDNEMVITFLPGSRISEIQRHSAPLIEAALAISTRWLKESRTKTLKFIVPLSTQQTYYEFELAQYLWQKKNPTRLPPKLDLMRGHAECAINISDFCVCGSGTATLEVALYHKPMVVFYRMNALSSMIMRRLYLLPWISLPNILTSSALVPEFMQNEVTGTNLSRAFFDIWDDAEQRQKLKKAFIAIHHSLQQPRLKRLKEALAIVGISQSNQ